MSIVNFRIFAAVLLFVVTPFAVGVSIKVVDTGFDLPNERLVGGQIALPGRFPYQVAVFGPDRNTSDDSVRLLCSGTIISELWVLTAAFYTHGQNPADFHVLAGAVNVTHGGDIVIVGNIIVHPNWTSTSRDLENNVALLQLSRPLAWSKFVSAVELKPRFVGNGVRAFVSGWGHTETGRPTNNLRYAQIYTLSNERCRQRLGNNSHIVFSSTLCAALHRGVGLCLGDAGVPLVASNRLIGIGSGFFTPCGSERPDLYTRISSYLDWILENTNVTVN